MKRNCELQEEFAISVGAKYVASDNYLKVGIAKNFNPLIYPINGLRHPVQGNTTGWYLWSGEVFELSDDFFRPLHTIHLDSCCPSAVKFLGLAPGWRFLFAPNQEEVWFDEKLLSVIELK
jgi:hypothetical protein